MIQTEQAVSAWELHIAPPLLGVHQPFFSQPAPVKVYVIFNIGEDPNRTLKGGEIARIKSTRQSKDLKTKFPTLEKNLILRLSI